jgi:hypothetical protein
MNCKDTDIEKPLLPYDLEEELGTYCLKVERNFFGLSTKSLLKAL